MRVEFHRHNIEEEDIDKVQEVLRSVFLTTGKVTKTFEKQFSDYTGLEEVVGVSSCTAALHLSLLALGIGPGDEVIIPAMTFIATATAVLHCGATPVLVDVEEDTGLIDVNKIERAITPRTLAIIPVHLYGTMADMKKIRKIADKNNLFIIEDCAHCIEGVREGIRPGQLGDTACYSFYATKNLTCGEGGAVGTRRIGIHNKLNRLRLHGMSKDAAGRYNKSYQHWDMDCLGWKYNMDDIHAALLVEQICRLDIYWKRRYKIYKQYLAELEDYSGITIPVIRGKSAHHLFTLRVDRHQRDKLLHGLQDLGIGVAVNYRSIHTLTYFRKTFGYKLDDFPVAEAIGSQTISLPLYPGLSKEQIKYVAESVKRVLGNMRS